MEFNFGGQPFAFDVPSFEARVLADSEDLAILDEDVSPNSLKPYDHVRLRCVFLWCPAVCFSTEGMHIIRYYLKIWACEGLGYWNIDGGGVLNRKLWDKIMAACLRFDTAFALPAKSCGNIFALEWRCFQLYSS